MASGELLQEAVQNLNCRDRRELPRGCHADHREEQDKNHNLLAHELRSILENGSTQSTNGKTLRGFERLPQSRERGSDLVEVRSVTISS